MSEADFIKLLAEMKEGNESMFEHIFLSHFETNIRYLRRTFKLSHSEAYDLCMETMVRFRDKLLKGKIAYGNLGFLFNQMSRHLFLQSLRRKDVHERALLSTLSFAPDTSEEKEYLFVLLKQAWESLGENCRSLLKSFYFDGVSLKDLAQQEQKSDVALRKQKQRCVAKLKSQMMRLMNQ
ncbi:MAG: sigma-70 family RNA polymerase sigma factor [Bacteroidota bacterium]